jgi:hypothetical protein
MKNFAFRSSFLATLCLFSLSVFAQSPACGEKDYDCQISNYQARIRSEPQNVELYFNLAGVFQDKGDFVQSVAM